MLNIYEDMSIDEILDESIFVYDFAYYGTKPVPANGTETIVINITSDADFLCKQITGGFTTLTGAAVDGGANGLSFSIQDLGRNINLFNTQIPANLVLSPGRSRSSGVAGDPSNSLFYPVEFIYPFLAGGSIVVELTSTLAQVNTFQIAFFGTKFRVAGRDKRNDSKISES